MSSLGIDVGMGREGGRLSGVGLHLCDDYRLRCDDGPGTVRYWNRCVVLRERVTAAPGLQIIELGIGS
jgi:hypothetical protein